MAIDNHVVVDGIVSHRDQQPYVRLSVNGEVAQLTVAAAHKICLDILKQSARIEADAMIFRFFDEMQYPRGAAAALMVQFRSFRQEQDDKPVTRTIIDPDTGDNVI